MPLIEGNRHCRLRLRGRRENVPDKSVVRRRWRATLEEIERNGWIVDGPAETRISLAQRRASNRTGGAASGCPS